MATLANQIGAVAVGWQIYEIARKAIALGYIGLAQFLPLVLFFFIAGDVADRFNRRRILSVTYGLRAVASAALLALAWQQTRSSWPIYVIMAAVGTARAFGQPAGQSFLPQLVSARQFPQAVAWTSSARQTAVIVGPALGGFLYIWGPATAYAVCLLCLLAATCGVSVLRTDTAVYQPDTDVSAFRRITAGIRFIRSHPLILGAISLDLFAVLLGGATALLPIYARDILRVGPDGLGLLRSAPAVGAAVTGFMLGRRALSQRAGRVMFMCVAIYGVATIVFGLSAVFLESLIALVIMGAADMVSVYVRSSLVQLATPDATRGRVSVVNSLFIGASNQLGEFESGVNGRVVRHRRVGSDRRGGHPGRGVRVDDAFPEPPQARSSERSRTGKN
jgi:MFS family permease